MSPEYIGRSLNILLTPGRINPIDVNEAILTDKGAIDEENPLDRSMYRVGSLGSNVLFSNDSEDEIEVKPTSIKIESKNFERIKLLSSSIKQIYPSVKPNEYLYRDDIHITHESLPSAVFDKYVHLSGVQLDAIRFKKGQLGIVMYSCGYDRIHIQTTSKILNRKRFDEFDIDTMMDIEELRKLTAQFFSEELEVSI